MRPLRIADALKKVLPKRRQGELRFQFDTGDSKRLFAETFFTSSRGLSRLNPPVSLTSPTSSQSSSTTSGNFHLLTPVVCRWATRCSIFIGKVLPKREYRMKKPEISPLAVYRARLRRRSESGLLLQAALGVPAARVDESNSRIGPLGEQSEMSDRQRARKSARELNCRRNRTRVLALPFPRDPRPK